MTYLDQLVIDLYAADYAKAVDAQVLAMLEPADPTHLPPTAPRIRVERCIDADVFGQVRYADGWLCIWGDGGSDWCPHLTWRNAMDCAIERARARAHGILGRW